MMKSIEFTFTGNNITRQAQLYKIRNELKKFYNRTGITYSEAVTHDTVNVMLPYDSAYTQFALLWPKEPKYLIPKFIF